MILLNNSCEDLASPSYVNFGLSILILFGILISYLPQHHRLISRRSSEGISPYFVLLGTTSGTFAFANILTLPASRANLACCREVSGFECFAGLLGIAQVGVQWVCFTVILLLFLIFFPRATPLIPPKSPQSTPSYRTALVVSLTCVLHAAITLILSILVLYRFPSRLQSWAITLGIGATALAAIQYIPQLVTTWRLQAVGSLSIPMMCIQTPGSFVWSGSLAKRLGLAGWSTWGIFLVTGILQGVVLLMCISFEFRDWKKRHDTDAIGPVGNGLARGELRDDVTDDDTEHTSLIRNEH